MPEYRHTFFFADPFLEDYFFAVQEEQDRIRESYRRIIDNDHAAAAVRFADAWPNLPKAAVTAAAVAAPHLPEEALADLVRRQAQVDGQERIAANDLRTAGLGGDLAGAAGGLIDGLGSVARGAVRTGLTIFDTLWQEGIIRPFKTALGTFGLTDQGPMSPWDAWEQAGSSFGTMALSRLVSGEEVNLGSGFLPRSDPNAPGDPITEQAHRQAETGLTRGGRPISPGRFLADFTWLEPGTGPYNVLSGALDAASLLLLDPGYAAIKSVSAWRRAQRTFTAVADVPTAAARITLPERIAQKTPVGLIGSAVRKTIHGQTADSFFRSQPGRALIDYSTHHVRPDNISDLATLLKGNAAMGPSGLPARFFMDVAEATDPRVVEQLWRQAIGRGQIPFAPTGPVGSQAGRLISGSYGAAAGFGKSMRRAVASDNMADRLFRQMPGPRLDIEDINNSFWQLDNFLTFSGFNAEQRSAYLARWSRIDPLDASTAGEPFRVIGDIMNEFGGSIKDQWRNRLGRNRAVLKVVEGEIDEFVNIWRSHENMVQYFTDGLGRAGWHPASGFQTIDAAGNIKFRSHAHLTTEMLRMSIPLPDMRQIRNILSPTRRNITSRLPQWVFDGPVPAGATRMVGQKLTGELRLQKYLLDKFTRDFWKPITLLRGAWTAKVIPEEVLRLTVSDFDTVLTHPLSYLAWIIDDSNANAFTRAMKHFGVEPRGRTGVLSGLEGVTDERLLLRANMEHRAAMSTSRGNMFRGHFDDPGHANNFTTVSRGQPGYIEGVSTELIQLANDQIAPIVALRGRAGAIEWAMSKEGRAWREWVGKRGSANQYSREVLASDDYLRTYIESIDARLHMKAGGRARLEFDFTGDGTGWQVIPEGNTNIPREFAEALIKDSPDLHRVRYTVTEMGNADLLDVIGRGAFEVDGVGFALYDMAKADLDAFNSFLKARADILPFNVKVPIQSSLSRNQQDKFVDRMYTLLMGRPTDFLNRSPAFRQLYWRRAEDLMSFTDDAGRAQIIRSARDANLSRTTLRRLETKAGQLRGTKGALSESSFYSVDDLAKAYALEGTKDLLYDLSRRSSFMDIYRNVFPFGEAFVEITGTWGRLLRNNPEAFRRGQQVIEGFRGIGFFTTDEQTGEEMFNYPGGGMLTRWLFNESPFSAMTGADLESGLTGGLELRGRVAGVNLVAGEVIPGFGPLVQFPAAMLMSGPRWDGIRKIISPFQDPDFQSVGGILDGILPAWAKRGFATLWGGSADQQRVLGNLQSNVYATLIMNGEDDSTPEARDALMVRAGSIADKLMWVVTLATFAAPTPPQVQFRAIPQPDRERIGDAAADEIEGRTWFYTALASEYSRLRHESGGDEVAAFDQFSRMFGIDPTLFISKTIQVAPRSVDSEGDRWGRENPDVFRRAPLTAYYAHPDDPTSTSFDYTAYVRSIREGARSALTPRQWEHRRQDLLGRIRYERAVREADEIWGPDASRDKTEALRTVRLWLMDEHPGYRHPNWGTAVQPNAEQRIAELYDVWPKIPVLNDSETGRAVRSYLAMRDRVIETAADMGIRNWQQSDDAFELRLILRRYAESLVRRHSDFSHLWQTVLMREMSRDDEDQLASLAAP